MRTIEIGDKNLKTLTSDNLIEIVKIIGCTPHLEYWNGPKVLDFNKTIFSDTIVIDYTSYRKSDNKKSCDYTFFFNFKNLSWHYIKDFERNIKQYRPHSQLLSIPVLKYLIENGFDIPLYNKK